MVTWVNKNEPIIENTMQEIASLIDSIAQKEDKQVSEI